MTDRLMLFMFNTFCLMHVNLATSHEDITYTVSRYSDTPVLECAALCLAKDICESFDVDGESLICYLSARGVRDSNIQELPESIYHHGLKTDLENDTSVCFSVGRLHHMIHAQRTADHVKKNTTERRNVRISLVSTEERQKAYRDEKTRAAIQDSDDAIQACTSLLTSMTLGTHRGYMGLRNVALKKHTKQSSNHTAALGPSNAVDGNADNHIHQRPNVRESCTHTAINYTTTAWWWVDLGSVYNIIFINILNRDNPWRRLSNFTISIGNHLTADLEVNYTTRCLQAEPFQGIKTFHCIEHCRGRYVMITLTNRPLTLCEVQVYSIR